MGDVRRFALFSSFVAERVGRESKVADVAAGKGGLTRELILKGFDKVEPFEPEIRKGYEEVKLWESDGDDDLSEKAERRRQRKAEKGLIGSKTLAKIRPELFTEDHAREFDVVVGLHPDGATDEIILGCAKYNKRMFLVPCCPKTSKGTYWGSKNDTLGWLKYCLGLCDKHGLKVKQENLKMNGKNTVLWV